MVTVSITVLGDRSRVRGARMASIETGKGAELGTLTVRPYSMLS